MAVIVGESGAWKEVQQLARQAGIVADKPADVGIQLAKAQKALLQQDRLARDDLAVQQAALEQKLADQRASSERDVALIRARSDADAAHLSERLSPARPWPAQAVARLRAQVLGRQLQAQTRSQIRRRSQAVLVAERALQDFIADHDTQVARRVEAARRIAQGIEALAHSRELAGAVAELEVIHTLSALPDSFTLLNDVRLTADHSLPYGGEELMTAQMGHLLVGPTGVYIIEARNCSKAFLADDAAGPVKQVKRASYLCWNILKEAGNSQGVHSIVACAGDMPDRSATENVAIMPIAHLLSYVQHTASQLSAEDVVRICRLLS
jgi:hypothetical protein